MKAAENTEGGKAEMNSAAPHQMAVGSAEALQFRSPELT